MILMHLAAAALIQQVMALLLMVGQIQVPHVGILVITSKVIRFNGAAAQLPPLAAERIFIGKPVHLVVRDGTNAELMNHLLAWQLEKVHQDLVDLMDSVMLTVSEAAAEHLIRVDSKAKVAAKLATGHILDVQD